MAASGRHASRVVLPGDVTSHPPFHPPAEKIYSSESHTRGWDGVAQQNITPTLLTNGVLGHTERIHIHSMALILLVIYDNDRKAN